MSRTAELIRTVDEQRAKIEKYEKKLKDVIQAYKGLLVEKNALEESLKAVTGEEIDETREICAEKCDAFELSSQKPPGSCVAVVDVSDVSDDSRRNVSFDTNSETRFGDRESVASSDTEDSATLRPPTSVGASTAKLVTLKRALATISSEKSRQEVAFTEDRKRLIAEQDALRNQLDNLHEENETLKEQYERQINELRSTVRNLHGERECEQSDHGAMLKELQQKLAQERMQNEHFTKQISNLTNELKLKEHQPLNLLERINLLSAENGKLKEKLSSAEIKLKELPNIGKLERTLAELKVEHKAALEKEQNKVRETENDNLVVRDQYEERVGVLETRIYELTATLSQYERHRIDDNVSVDGLKNRIKSLENENQMLATNSSKANVADSCASFNEVVIKCQQLVQRLKSMQNENEKQDIFSLLGLDTLTDVENLHYQCKKELDLLRDDYEKYKIRAQALLKSKNISKDVQDSGEIVHLRQMIVTLQQQLQESKSLKRSNEKEYQTNLDELRRTIAIMKESHAKELLELKQTCERRIVGMESETTKQRDRTLEVLVEKEKEISALRSLISGGRPGSDQSTASMAKGRSESRSSFHSVEGVDSDQRRANVSDSDIFATPTDPAPTNIYYSQELAKKEKEIGYLKRDLRRLEAQLIEVQHSVVTKELTHFELTEKLKEELRNLETKLARYSDNSNLEYLKNVFVQFALSNDTVNKQHMLKAISVALKLNSKETDLLLRHYVKHAWFVKSTK